MLKQNLTSAPVEHQCPHRPGQHSPAIPPLSSADHPRVPAERLHPPLQQPDAAEPGAQRGLHEARHGEAHRFHHVC